MSVNWENERLRLQVTSLVLLENIYIKNNFSPADFQLCPATQLSALWFFSRWLCYNSRQWHLRNYNYANQQHAGWTLDKEWKLSSNTLLCRLFWFWKVQFSPIALQTDDARTTTEPSQRLRFLHDKFSFSSLQITTKKVTGVHGVNVHSFIKK